MIFIYFSLQNIVWTKKREIKSLCYFLYIINVIHKYVKLFVFDPCFIMIYIDGKSITIVTFYLGERY